MTCKALRLISCLTRPPLWSSAVALGSQGCARRGGVRSRATRGPHVHTHEVNARARAHHAAAHPLFGVRCGRLGRLCRPVSWGTLRDLDDTDSNDLREPGIRLVVHRLCGLLHA
eukprot:4170169-Prymnesium_polylepis.1